jgi:hypothetical protein
MQQLIPIVRLELTLILGLLALVVAYKMLTGAINMRGLLDDKVSGGLSPGRVQLMISTVMGAGYYLMLAFERAPDGKLPDLPEEALLLVGGSQLLYLGGKARSHLFR